MGAGVGGGMGARAAPPRASFLGERPAHRRLKAQAAGQGPGGRRASVRIRRDHQVEERRGPRIENLWFSFLFNIRKAVRRQPGTMASSGEGEAWCLSESPV